MTSLLPGRRGIQGVLVSCETDSSGDFAGNASDNNSRELQFFGTLAGFTVINNNNTANAWDLSITDQDGVAIYTSTSVSSADAMFIPDKAGVTGTGVYHTFPVSGALSITVAGVTASTTPKVRFYFQQ